MLKKYIGITIFVSWAFFTAVLVAGLVFYQNSKPMGSVIAIPTANATNGANTPLLTLSIQEVAKHDSRSSCWLIIDNQVYDVTTYLDQHPGNAGTILPYCGQEATAAFNDKGRPGGSTHSNYAATLLQNYLLGTVDQAVTQSTARPTVTVSPTKTTNPSVTNSSAITLTQQEIAKHNNGSDCWLIINQQVYNVTTYLNQHPGNASAILPYCGQEATAAFDTKGRPGGNPHSGTANSLLQQFLIGSVGATISQSVVNPSVTIPPRRGGGDD
jgi:cytochrome b involved in lipid metabolism